MVREGRNGEGGEEGWRGKGEERWDSGMGTACSDYNL